ncbi:MAG: 3-oxoacyl-[acyl-carrier-protein] reductase [Planctomycetes bacterium]|nr:3-oxoacyl-[acyl-carrier-protein] reductase [Planctomycetota bacterium]
MADLSNQAALVTGAARGIGKAIAMELARAGADVAVCDIALDTSEAAAEEIRALGRRAIGLKADVSKAEEVDAAVAKTVEALGKLDILVNNAGITRDGLLLRMSDEQWETVLAVNLRGTFLATRAAAKVMVKQRSGAIVNIASVTGLIGNAGQANYASSKAAVIGLTKTTARELAARGIRVNAVAPGFIETEMTRVLPDQAKQAFLTQIPLARPGTPEEVARVVTFLASPDASYITGQTIPIDGGMVMM